MTSIIELFTAFVGLQCGTNQVKHAIHRLRSSKPQGTPGSLINRRTLYPCRNADYGPLRACDFGPPLVETDLILSHMDRSLPVLRPSSIATCRHAKLRWL